MIRRITRVIEQARALVAEARPYKSVPRQIYELFEHKIRINTSFRDYYRFEFFKRNADWTAKSLYIGPNGSRYWPHETNSLKFDAVFAKKSMQKALLVGFGLPTPRLLLTVGEGSQVDTLEKFREALEEIKGPFVSKFDGGGGGSSILVFERNGHKIFRGKDEVDADWIWAQYASNFERGFYLEGKAENHPTLARLNSTSLNTIRVMVLQTMDGRWHVLKSFLKIGRRDSQVDNLSAKGLFAILNSSGVADAAYCRFDDKCYERHPDSEAPIAGLKVPYFDASMDLAVRAAKKLSSMRTYGWDIAITKDGPTLIEANPGWHFKALQQRHGPLLTPEIAAGLIPRAWYTPWDKSRMYPGYLNDYSGGVVQRFMAARRKRWKKKRVPPDHAADRKG